MTSQIWWYAARSAGIVSWIALCMSVAWGLVMSTRFMRQKISRPWMLGTHRALSGFAVIFVLVHIVSLIADSYTHFDIVDMIVPFASSWKPLATAWGVVAFWIILAVELTSLARKHLPNILWKRIHLASFILFICAAIHGLTAGTDATTMWAIGSVICIVIPIVVLSIVRINRWVNEPISANYFPES